MQQNLHDSEQAQYSSVVAGKATGQAKLANLEGASSLKSSMSEVKASQRSASALKMQQEHRFRPNRHVAQLLQKSNS